MKSRDQHRRKSRPPDRQSPLAHHCWAGPAARGAHDRLWALAHRGGDRARHSQSWWACKLALGVRRATAVIRSPGSEVGDQIYWHQFDAFADTPDVALGQTIGALKGAGRFESFSVSESDKPRQRAVDWSVIGSSTLDHASRAVLEAPRPGPKPEWILRADPRVPAAAQDLLDLLGHLRRDGYLEHLGPNGWWQLSDRVRAAIAR